MDDLARIRTFLNVANCGSFSAAARNVSAISSVARQINQLEAELGVPLLHRSTHGLTLTDVGRTFFERAAKISHDLSEAVAEAKSLHEVVQGRLKVQLRVTTGTTIVVPALPRLLEKYPKLELDLVLSDERRSLIANQIDVAIWLGEMSDADVVARRLGVSERVVCASPEYLKKHGTPLVPEDLKQHDCLVYAVPTNRNAWRFAREGTVENVEMHGSVRSDNGLLLLASSIAGLGVVISHEWMVRKLIFEGKLTRILSDYAVVPRAGTAEMYAVYPSSSATSAKVRVFVEFLVQTFSAVQQDGTEVY